MRKVQGKVGYLKERKQLGGLGRKLRQVVQRQFKEWGRGLTKMARRWPILARRELFSRLNETSSPTHPTPMPLSLIAVAVLD
jgi:hypothetical protein